MTADVAQQVPASSFEVFKPDDKPLLVRGPIGDVFANNVKKSRTVSRASTRGRRLSAKPLLQDVPPAATLPPESNINLPSPRYSRSHSNPQWKKFRPRNKTHPILRAVSRPSSKTSSRFGAYSQASFFSRHNPHPSRVRHIKGLNDQPICAVNDDGYFPPQRFNISTPSTREREKIFNSHIPLNALGLNSSAFPINTITGLQNYPFKEKAIPSIGLVPVTDTWRDELREFCMKAGIVPELPQAEQPPPLSPGLFAPPKRRTIYSAETGRLIPPPSRAMSRQASRQASRQGYNNQQQNFMHISSYPDTETIMLEMLCQILQTDSVHAVQQWLVSAGDREKSLVLDMIKSAMSHEDKVLREQEAQKEAMIQAGSRPGTTRTMPIPSTPMKKEVSSRPATSPMQPTTNDKGAEILKLEERVKTPRSPRKSARPLGTPASGRASRVKVEQERNLSPIIRYTKTPNSATRKHTPLDVIKEIETEDKEGENN